MSRVGIVIPCYNEETRLSRENLLQLVEHSEVRVLLVNDGSKDNTLSLLQALSQENPGISYLDLPRNGGKGEAVRQGLEQLLLDDSLSWVGFVDADFSTPPQEILRLVDLLRESKAQVVMGSRVRLLGYLIERKLLRHYLGRVFATLASMTLRIPVYDTQCGCKFFRKQETLKTCLQNPFRSRWVFDVELLSRILKVDPKSKAFDSYFSEVPLRAWKDVGGSKLSFSQMLGAFWDLFKIFLRSLF